MKQRKYIKSMDVSIVSKSTFKVCLCCKQLKQDDSWTSKTLGKIACTTPQMYCLIDFLSKNGTFNFVMAFGYVNKNMLLLKLVLLLNRYFLMFTSLIRAQWVTLVGPASNKIRDYEVISLSFTVHCMFTSAAFDLVANAITISEKF